MTPAALARSRRIGDRMPATRIPGDGVDDATRAQRAMRRHHVAAVLQGEGREDIVVLAVAENSVVLPVVHAVAGGSSAVAAAVVAAIFATSRSSAAMAG